MYHQDDFATLYNGILMILQCREWVLIILGSEKRMQRYFLPLEKLEDIFWLGKNAKMFLAQQKNT